MPKATDARRARKGTRTIPAERTDSTSCAIDMTDFMGSASEAGVDTPQAFLVEIDEPGGSLEPHFHRVDQFQVFVRGSGRVGKQDLSVVSIQYADAFTPYGPIVAGAEGLAWYTLRRRHDSGAHVMPGSREAMERQPGRNLTCRRESAEPETLAAADAVLEPLLRVDDGMAVYDLRCGSDSHFAALDPGDGGGQFHVVLRGSVEYAGQRYPGGSCLYVGPDEDPLRYRTGAGGAEVLLVQFPSRRD